MNKFSQTKASSERWWWRGRRPHIQIAMNKAVMYFSQCELSHFPQATIYSNYYAKSHQSFSMKISFLWKYVWRSFYQVWVRNFGSNKIMSNNKRLEHKHLRATWQLKHVEQHNWKKIMQKSWSTIELLCSYTAGEGGSPQFISLNQRKRKKLWEEIHTNLFLDWFLRFVFGLFMNWLGMSASSEREFVEIFGALMISLRLKVAHFIDRKLFQHHLVMEKKINCFEKLVPWARS